MPPGARSPAVAGTPSLPTRALRWLIGASLLLASSRAAGAWPLPSGDADAPLSDLASSVTADTADSGSLCSLCMLRSRRTLRVPERFRRRRVSRRDRPRATPRLRPLVLPAAAAASVATAPGGAPLVLAARASAAS